ncbi:hypothetical protein CARUB_v10001201mg [Capsella rubella]|uniref:Fungal lipase-type domain-containing protein n=1 Tax=Capsella rubella TaxID=81985 RepID=R0HB48_9BRAS|nr:GDSL esterase/lipase At4g10955 [Capsella rubella]EOA20863.1 hypothetical protein CARUB_v10001201mg [Capsella rubella]
MGIGSLAKSDTSDFNTHGPSHLTTPDWTSPCYQTAVLACLVNGAYTMEKDRRIKQKKRYRFGFFKCPEPLANLWWEKFGFDLEDTLYEDDGTIYGAVFKYKNYSFYKNDPGVKVPEYVIAFRGTVLNKKTWIADIKLGIQCIFNTLHRGGRPTYALDKIRRMVDKHSDSKIWLAGHSSGAALVLIAGKTMASSGCFLESHAFNPPFSSIPYELLPGGKFIKHVFRTGKSVVKSAIAMFAKKPQDQEDKSKTALWIPHIYVNHNDPICLGYIHYLRHRSFMSKIGAGGIEILAAGVSYASLLVGKVMRSPPPSKLSKEPLYVLPTAAMTVNNNKPTKSTPAHALHQWWEANPAVRVNWESYRIRSHKMEKLKQLTL